MVSVDVRQFKQQFDRILEDVETRGEVVELTRDGHAVATIRPLSRAASPRAPMSEDEQERVWAEWDALAERISTGWPEGVSAVDAVRDVRRDL